MIRFGSVMGTMWWLFFASTRVISLLPAAICRCAFLQASCSSDLGRKGTLLVIRR